MRTPPPGDPPPPAAPPTHCAACSIALTPGSRFCHRCGTPLEAMQPVGVAPPANVATAASPRLPWIIGGITLVAMLAFAWSRRPPSSASDASLAIPLTSASPEPGRPGAPPDIGSLTPSERASRLCVRVMEYAEAGKTDSIAAFAPMVIAAHQMLSAPSVDERYHFGRVAEVVGAKDIAAAQADTILAGDPTSLLGLLLAARAARLSGDKLAARGFDQRLLANVRAQLATENLDYDNHRAEIDRAVEEARRAK